MRVTVLDAVRPAYNLAGLSLLPVRADGTKAPDVSSWRQYTDTRASIEQMRAWDFAGRVGFGMLAGKASGYRECWDFDDASTFEAFIAAAEASGLGDVVARIRNGYEDETPGGGRRWVVTYPTSIEWHDCTLARRHGGTGEPKVKTLIELPTFAILAPSNGGTHPSGRPYVRRSGGFETIASYRSDERAALIELARSFDQMPRREAGPKPAGASRPDSDLTRPGDDFNRRMTWPAVLDPRGWRHVYDRGEVSVWRRPGKTEGISATTNYGGSDLFYPFTSSSEFDPDTSYSKFAVYAILEHGGDYSRAAQALAREGYGRDNRPAAVRVTADADVPSRSVPAVPVRQDWPKPIAPEAHIGVFGDLIAAIAPHTEADPAAILLQLLTMFGNVIGRTAYFRAEADTHYLNLDVAIVGQSAKGRKGVSTGRSKRIFEGVDSFWTANCQKSGLSSGEGLIWAVRDPIEKQAPIKAQGRVVEYETVIEDPGVTDKRLLVIEPEFASTLKVLGREGNTLSALMRQAWDGQDLRVLTKNSPARCTGPHISVIANITSEELRRYLDATESANGFGNRFLWCCAKRSQLLPDGGGFVDLDPLLPAVRLAVDFAREAGELKRDDGARELWHAVYASLSAGRPGLLGAITGRAEAQTMRLACLYALSERSRVVQRRHLEAALAVWRYCFDSAAYVFGMSLGDPTADAILQAIQNAGDTGMTRTEISMLFGRHRAAADIDRALAVLEGHSLARQGQRDTTGRPATCWFYAPPACEKSEISGEGGGLSSLNSLISHSDKPLVGLSDTEAGEL
jgi:hypothetical protein